MPTTKSSFIVWPYFLMIASGLMIPSDGNHGFLSIKSLSFLSATACVGMYAFLKQKISVSQLKLVIFMIFSLAFLGIWLLISFITNDTTSTARFDQFKLFLITILFPLSSLYLIQEEMLSRQQLVKAIIYSSFAYTIMKVLVVALHLMHLIDVWSLMESFGIRFMRMNILGGVERVQTSVDIVTPFLIFFVLQSKRLGIQLSSSFKILYIIFSFLSTFLSFSATCYSSIF